MDNGFIILHRKIRGWEWYKNSIVKDLFLHLLIEANHKDNKWQGIDVKRGQLITGRKSLAEDLGFSEMQIRTALNKLKLTNEITIKSTNKYSVITINNYDMYQTNNQQDNKRVTNKQPTNNQQITTNNNDNNVNNENNNIADESARPINEVNVLIAKFEPVNPSFKRLFANKTQRSAMERLIKDHSFEKMETLLDKLPEIVSRPFAPKITTPLELEQGFGKLVLFIKQESSNVGKKRGGFVDVG